MGYFQYYGSDWLALAFTFWGIWQIGNKNKLGFVLMIFGNAAWIAVGYLTDSMAMIITNVGLCIMNIRAIIKWSGSERH
jgi:hypothetical protein